MSIFLLFSVSTQAAWYEDEHTNWWIVVYSQMRCAPASDFDAMLKPAPLVNVIGCQYESQNSEPDQIASIGCEEVEGLDTGFIFAVDQEYCERYLYHLNKVMQETQQ